MAATWLWVFGGYFFLIDESKAFYYVFLISERMGGQNFIITTIAFLLSVLYGIFLVEALVNLLQKMIYHFLHLRYEGLNRDEPV